MTATHVPRISIADWGMLGRRAQRRLFSAVAAAALCLVRVEAMASPFQVIAPPACPTMQEVNWTYNVSSAGASSGWMLPDDPNHRGYYISSLNNSTGIAANELVTSFGVHIDTFQLERHFDFFEIGTNGSIPVSLTGGSNYGNPISGWYDVGVTFLPTGLPPYIHFYSDFDATDAGVYADRARVCSNNPNAALTGAATWLPATQRTSGVLLGTGDVVYFAASVGSTKSGDTCSSAHDTFALWGDPTVGNDFDLYVRCNALPTDTQFDYRGYSGDTQEFVHATSASCPCGSTWYVAVHSWSGSGWFNVVQHKHYSSEHGSGTVQVYAVSSSTVPAATMSSYAQQVSVGFKHFFGANEGARYWDSIGLYQSQFLPDHTIGIMADSTGRPYSDKCASDWDCFWGGACAVHLYKDWYDGPTLSHELGHHVNCLSDEYEDSVGTECGHSIMGSQFYTNTNYCWCNNQPSGYNKCANNAGDHGFDPTPPNTTALQTGTAWINLQSRTPVPMNSTPDNYDYTQFDFNDMYGVVTIY